MTMNDIGLIFSPIHFGNPIPNLSLFGGICKQRQYAEQDLGA